MNPAHSDARVRLIVFADDWGRHPSSCQHLIRILLADYPVLWVNSIGTRAPQLNRADMRRTLARLAQWAIPPHRRPLGPAVQPDIVTPPMWPAFRRPWQCRLNARVVGGAVNRALRQAGAVPGARVVITTVPISGAFIDAVAADAWIYYCVDNYAEWPGADAAVMHQLEARLLTRADAIVVASATLQRALQRKGYDSTLLTHGVDPGHWTAVPPGRSLLPDWWHAAKRPRALFWGLIDGRFDVDWLRALVAGPSPAVGSVVLLGPQQSSPVPPLPTVVMPGAVPYAALPQFAADADVLVMPYVDAAVTHCVQPLKLKEYLATGKPVVVRSLPATREWADAADVVETREAFTRAVAERVATGVPATQQRARARLAQESWDIKAHQFACVLRRCIAESRNNRAMRAAARRHP